MDFLQGKTIIYKDNELILADVALKKKVLILYYFTSADCENCRVFDEKLRNVYQEALVRRLEMAVIVVSSDPDKETFLENIKTNYQDWYALQFNDELLHALMYNYGVSHIPALIVVRKNGDVVTREGRFDVEKLGINVLVTWAE